MKFARKIQSSHVNLRNDLLYLLANRHPFFSYPQSYLAMQRILSHIHDETRGYLTNEFNQKTS